MHGLAEALGRLSRRSRAPKEPAVSQCRISVLRLLIGSFLFVCWSQAALTQNATFAPEIQSVQQHSSFDGRWIANVPPQGRCPASRMTLEVRGRSILGIVVNYSGAFPIVGSLGPGGEGRIQIVRMGGRIRFANNYFVADYFNACGPRHAVGVKIGRPLVRLL
jgi:hypothetical protein